MADDIKKLAEAVENLRKSVGFTAKDTKEWNLSAHGIFKSFTNLSGPLKAAVAAESAFAAAAYDALQTSEKYNKVLAETSGGIINRNRLVSAGLSAQMATGSSVEDTASAMAALVELGIKDAEVLKNNTTVALELHGALGLSLQTSAELAAQAKALGVNFREVGDVIAVVAQNTALSSREAAKYNANISRALIAFQGKKGGSFFKDITLEVDAFESKMKEATGGISGGISKLIEAVARGEGAINRLYGIGALGGLQDIEKIMDTLSVQVGRAKALYANSPEIMNMVLKSISEIYTGGRISIEEMSQLTPEYVASSKELYKTLDANRALSKAYADQSVRTGALWMQITNTVRSLIDVGLQPLVSVLNTVLSFVNQGVQFFKDWVGGSRVFMTSLVLVGTTFSVVVAVMAVRSLSRLVAAVRDFGSAMVAEAHRIRRAAGTSGGVGVEGMGGLGSWGPTIAPGRSGMYRLRGRGQMVAGVASMVAPGLLESVLGVSVADTIGGAWANLSWTSITRMVSARAVGLVARGGLWGLAAAITGVVFYSLGKWITELKTGVTASAKDVKTMFEARSKTVDAEIKLLNRYAVDSRVSIAKYNKTSQMFIDEAMREGEEMRSGWEKLVDFFITRYNEGVDAYNSTIGKYIMKPMDRIKTYAQEAGAKGASRIFSGEIRTLPAEEGIVSDFVNRVMLSQLGDSQKMSLLTMALGRVSSVTAGATQQMSASRGANTDIKSSRLVLDAASISSKIISDGMRNIEQKIDNHAKSTNNTTTQAQEESDRSGKTASSQTPSAS